MAFDRIIIHDIIFGMTPEKEKYYEQATRKLLNTIDTMGLDKPHRLRAKNLILLFRDSFKLPTVKYKTFAAELGNNIGFLKYDSDGFCRVSSLTFGLLMGAAPDWKLMYIDDIWTYGPHHFLFHVPSKQILDITFDQYTNYHLDIPYDIARELPYNLIPNDNVLSFSNAVGIDLLAELKKQKE